MSPYDNFLFAVHEERAARDAEDVIYGDVYMNLLREQRPDVVVMLMGMLVSGELDNEVFRRDSLDPKIHSICEKMFMLE